MRQQQPHKNIQLDYSKFLEQSKPPSDEPTFFLSINNKIRINIKIEEIFNGDGSNEFILNHIKYGKAGKYASVVSR